jgi:hypothetical protein
VWDSYVQDISVGTSVSSAPKRETIFHGRLRRGASNVRVSGPCNGSYSTAQVVAARPAAGITIAVDKAGGGQGSYSYQPNLVVGMTQADTYANDLIFAASYTWQANVAFTPDTPMRWHKIAKVLGAGASIAATNVPNGYGYQTVPVGGIAEVRGTYSSSNNGYSRTGGIVSYHVTTVDTDRRLRGLSRR